MYLVVRLTTRRSAIMLLMLCLCSNGSVFSAVMCVCQWLKWQGVVGGSGRGAVGVDGVENGKVMRHTIITMGTDYRMDLGEHCELLLRGPVQNEFGTF